MQNGNCNGSAPSPSDTRSTPSPNGSDSGKAPMKYILVTGGVISGVGKGIISSSLGVLLKNNGYKVSAIKIDPYLNVDAGTFSPYEHGEVFVLDDGGEVDLDCGNYERFLNVRLTRDNNLTTGKLYSHVIEKERRGDYRGRTVQMIPHVADEAVAWIERVAKIPVDGSGERPDVCIIELGGTVGDTEGGVYYSAFEKFQRPSMKPNMMVVHVSLLLHPKATGEPKTKPMQNSMRCLRQAGIVPDLVICRSTDPLQEHLRTKIANFGLIEPEQVMGVHDVSNIYKVPLLLQSQGIVDQVIQRLHLDPVPLSIRSNVSFSMGQWAELSELYDSFTETVTIALVGKYTSIEDAYASVNKALSHAAMHGRRHLKIKFVESEHLEEPKTEDRTKFDKAWADVKSADGIIVPGGFDKRGVEGMIKACQYARENKVPYLGVCLGMQCAAIEFARNVLGIKNANSTEFNQELDASEQIIIDMPEHNIEKCGFGASMRLGRRTTAFLTDNCTLYGLYGQQEVEERHRHRYEVNPAIVPTMARKGFLFVGMGVDEKSTTIFAEPIRTASSNALLELAEKELNENLLEKIDQLCQRGGDGVSKTAVRMEMFELADHPYFVGAQYHPEYLSAPLDPSPPFLGLILAATGQLKAHLDGSKVIKPLCHALNRGGQLKKQLLSAGEATTSLRRV